MKPHQEPTPSPVAPWAIRSASDARQIRAEDIASYSLRTGQPYTEDVACPWQTLAVTLELAQRACPLGQQPAHGTAIEEMRWWDEVRAGDLLRVHLHAFQDPATGTRRRRLLLWTVNQYGRCVFSCLLSTPLLP